jgi:diadenosine tetraphosphate (Ap4A) HIT family hydrolase
MACELCDTVGGDLLHEDARGLYRIVLVGDPDYPGFCRVVAKAHVREVTDLPPPERARLLEAVFACEEALREVVRPDKVNLASLGNATPHVHWHVIPRWEDDPCFPAPIWASPRRGRATRPAAEDLEPRLRDALGKRLTG